MPRTARLVLPGYLYHVTQRGNFQQNVFEDDQDRVVYLKNINNKSMEYGNIIYAYCLMDNHVHFVLKPLHEKSMAGLFRTAHMKYSHYFNRKKKQKGHLWQGRFYSCLVNGSHIKEVFRYVENNPVRAGMVDKAWHYSWSSARAHLRKKYKVIDLADVSEYFDADNWKKYLSNQENETTLKMIREKTRKGLILATKDFIDRWQKRLDVQLIPNPRGRPKNSVCP